jgi:hypothetical protein
LGITPDTDENEPLPTTAGILYIDIMNKLLNTLLGTGSDEH